MEHNKLMEVARLVIKKESDALVALASHIDENFSIALSQIASVTGRVILSGVGKSSHIAKKIASTFSSTGTAAIFLHPSEASHGDLGMIKAGDLLIILSRSGESRELKDLSSYCSKHNIPTIAVTSKLTSTLAKNSELVLLIPDIEEACVLGLAPTSSSIMMLSLGDALAIGTLVKKGFSKEDFRGLHPAGSLGTSLLKVTEVMGVKDQMPLAAECATVSDAILEMTRCRFGCVGITDSDGKLVGIFTDGDLRRNSAFLNLSQPISQIMSVNPKIIEPSAYLTDVLKIIKDERIPSVFVCSERKPIGIVHLHDLLQKGLA